MVNDLKCQIRMIKKQQKHNSLPMVLTIHDGIYYYFFSY